MAESTVVSCPNCGKKFKVGADKLGRIFKCTGCETRFKAGEVSEVVSLPAPVPTPPPPVAPMPSEETEYQPDRTGGDAPVFTGSDDAGGAVYQNPKKSGMSIASLVCGILLCLAPLSSLLAIIFGFLGLKKSRQGFGGRGMSIAGIVLGVVGLILTVASVVVVLPALQKARGMANRLACGARMHVVGTSIMGYCQQNHQYPPDLATLWKNDPSLKGSNFICPETTDTPATGPADLMTPGHLSFTYLYPGADAQMGDMNRVILYERPTNHAGEGTNICFGDGRVEWKGAQESAALISKNMAKK